MIDLAIPTICLIAAIAILYLAAEALIHFVVVLSQKFAISRYRLSASLVAIGTSLPELITCSIAQIHKHSELAVSNIIGSNTSNFLLIGGFSFLFIPQKKTIIKGLKKDLNLLIPASIIISSFIYYNIFNNFISLLILFFFFIYLVFLSEMGNDTYGEKPAQVEEDGLKLDIFKAMESSNIRLYLATLASLLAMLLGGKLLVQSAVNLATALSVSDRWIGISVVAIGTSAPELATTIVARLKRETEIALGNLVGSNLFNLLAILPITRFLGEFHLSLRLVSFDMAAMLLASIAFSLILRFNCSKKIPGAIFLLSYLAYLLLTTSP